MKIWTNLINLFCFILTMFLLSVPGVYAQEALSTISGTIKDNTGSPVIGATIIDVKTQKGTISDIDGLFELTVTSPSTLKITYVGYREQEIQVRGDKRNYEIVLQEDNTLIDEVVVVGYGVQKKINLTGAISSVKNDEIITTKNENLQNMLTGKIAGLRVLQNSSEPGRFNTTMDIRGFGAPLVVIDGVPRNNMARLDPEDIESISVIKDATGAVYGSRAANGVIIITTKKGSKTGQPSINYTGNITWQRPSNYPDLVGAADWMTLYNETQKHNVDNSSIVPRYTAEEIESYRNGTNVSTNWKEKVMRSSAPATQHTLSASGGNETVTYFASIGYQDQGSFLKTDAINYEKYTLRSNISAKVADHMQFDVNLSGLLDERQSSPYGSNDIVRAMWLHHPMDQVYYDQEAQQYGMMDWNVILNPVAMMDKDLVGENSYKSKWFQSNISLTYEVPFVKGLSLKTMYSYDYTLNDDKEYSKSFSLYLPTGGEYKANTQTSGNSKISRFFYGKSANLWQAQIAYNRQFGDHSVSVMNLLENSHYVGDNFNGSRYLVLPLPQIFAGITENQEIRQSTSSGALYDYANAASVGRLSYDYKSRYMAEFAYRYEGSSKFPANSRWGLFPSVSGGWRVSDENFWKSSPLNFIDNLKLRASYGITGDDSALSYQFVSGYQYPSSGNRTGLPAGYIFGDSFISSSSNTGIANTAITWYKSKTFNIGVDAIAWEGLLGITAEYFKRDRTGLLTTRLGSLPGIVGANLPQENLNSDQNKGFEIELSHLNHIRDFRYQIKGNISYTRTRTRYYEMAELGNSYLNWRNGVNERYNNIWWGYAGNGRIENWDEIYHNPVFVGRGTILGDYEYKDWNGDGWISDLDVHPLATNGQVPLFNYGFTLNAQWKGLDLTMLWQGAGKKYVIPREFLYQPLWSNTNAISDFLDRWRPADPANDPYDPATEWIAGHHGYTGTLPNVSSDFNIQNAAYLRLKTVELGYSLPENLLKKIDLKDIRIFVSAYNLLTFTRLRYMDPEFYTNNTSSSGLTNLGYNYPINKTFSMGINVKF
ncbi:MAG: SusC/RagA family TonB-linked outer membrane protein [Bacteroidetes bacterium GWD2_45_23]|nr:MAG: SusC/RagA family TonB-linked outer membrane protein [Bacteroidetes bacterium GWC2_46_850]OFX84629.1 MAG: SusC/RagA family TonB-linked outer membrane protein [Bacteroidetes bacterium GWD2_45_23]HBB00137.1 SusC/RagA family TonB-linked outer membrane protein [Porphyromonadaceae bacterium]HCC18188.1 SusC/RagA family TonB-linked outer membrane protein [Porphyromonadaceae bacterium]